MFPNGKRYVGCTKATVKQRWNGGLGYENQSLVFGAILKYGWNNIRHYILMDGLSKDEALLYEAAFIYSWKTYKKSWGYNTVFPNIAEAKEINIPTLQKCKKARVYDIYEDETSTRLDNRYLDPTKRRKWLWKKVRCIESGKVYDNAEEASWECGSSSARAIQDAIYSGYASGTCQVYNDETGTYWETPAHWEYVN